MIRQANYLRVSSIGQEDTYSLTEQERDCNRHAQQQRNEVVANYNDRAQKSFTLDRPKLNRLMQDARSGLFDVVVVGRYDRFSRNQVQQAVAIYQLEQYGVQIKSACEPVPEGAVGTFLRNSFAFAAELELYNIRGRTTAGRKARIRAGKMLAGVHPLYGYSWANANQKHGKDHYDEDPETAWVVRLIFQLIASNRTLHSIALELEQRGIPTPGQVLQSRGQLARGKTCSSVWRLSTLGRILSNQAYIGKHSGWRHVTEDVQVKDPVTGEIHTVSRVRELDEDDPERIWFPAGVCPPLVDEATFATAQGILKRNKQQAAHNVADPEAALLRNGFAVCGYCGRWMQSKLHNKNEHYRYWCATERDTKSVRCEMRSRSFKTEDLDTIVWNWVVRAFEDPEIIHIAFESWRSNQVAGRSYEYDRLESMKQLIQMAERRWKNCIRSASEAPDEETCIEFTRSATEAREEMVRLRKEEVALSAILGQHDNEISHIENIVDMGQKALNLLRSADYQDKRAVLHALGVKLHIKTLNDYYIEWRLEHIPPTMTQGQLFVPED